MIAARRSPFPRHFLTVAIRLLHTVILGLPLVSRVSTVVSVPRQVPPEPGPGPSTAGLHGATPPSFDNDVQMDSTNVPPATSRCAVYNVPCTMCHVPCAMYNVQCAMYNVQSAIRNPQSAIQFGLTKRGEATAAVIRIWITYPNVSEQTVDDGASDVLQMGSSTLQRRIAPKIKLTGPKRWSLGLAATLPSIGTNIKLLRSAGAASGAASGATGMAPMKNDEHTVGTVANRHSG
ncbi:hypothetical protein F4803DRAFT_547284 [Xylaria telfairii]|nr:hypothetical protein F4803DRAFT_547284 [Xylaria telfairii]